jgi:hypothetical protein
MPDGAPSLPADHPSQTTESIIYRHVRVVDECKSGSDALSADCFLTATHRAVHAPHGYPRRCRLRDEPPNAAARLRAHCRGSLAAFPFSNGSGVTTPRWLETLRSCIDPLAGNKTGMRSSVRESPAMAKVFGLQKSTTFESADLSMDYLVVDE